MAVDQSGNYFYKLKSILKVLPKEAVILSGSEAPLVLTGSWILRSISYNLARKGSKTDVTSVVVVGLLTWLFKEVFNVLLIHLRILVKPVLVRFSST